MDSRRISLSWAALLIAVGLFWAGMCRAEVVEIPDPILEAAIRHWARIEESEPVTAEAIGSMWWLWADNVGIRNLEGLQHATRLDLLRVSGNEITDLSPLSGLTRLKSVSVQDNQIQSLAPLSGNDSLWRLSAENNLITDMSPILDLPALRSAGLGWNQIRHIVPPGPTGGAGLSLGLSANPIEDYSPLEEWTSLEGLGLGDQGLTDISFLSGLRDLKFLGLTNNSIRDLDPLVPMLQMETLSLSNNDISDLSPLAGMPDLKEVYVCGNWISDLSPLTGLRNLEFLGIPYRSLDTASLDVHVPAIIANNPDISILYGPVPEPSVIWLLASAGFAIRRRRRYVGMGGSAGPLDACMRMGRRPLSDTREGDGL